MQLRPLFATALSLSLLWSSGFPLQSEAANGRQPWVVKQIYTYNHPFVATLPNELATKMTKMALSAFSFYRGTAHLFYEDLKDTKLWAASAYSNATTNGVWIDGDMHMQNMGGLRDSSDTAVFDTNDFDEGYLGSYTWDLQRMAVSILLAAEENGISVDDRQALVKNFVESYVAQIAAFKGNEKELSYRLTANDTNGVVKDIIQAAAGKNRPKFLGKYTVVNAGQRRFQASEGSLTPVDSNTLATLKTAVATYVNSIPAASRKSNSYYTLKDAALRSGSGTGSLGRYRYYLLIEGDSADNNDDVLLEMKQETDSAVSIAVPNNLRATTYDGHNGKRVFNTLRAMSNNPDGLAGYTTFNNLPFFLHERSPYQEDFDYTVLKTYSKFNDAVKYMGQIIAKNHARSDKDYDAKIISSSMDKEITEVIKGDVSGLKKEVLSFAEKYAAQVKQDYQDFVAAKNSGATLY
jgi:uncharacterized protein (DUF2252 family)